MDHAITVADVMHVLGYMTAIGVCLAIIAGIIAFMGSVWNH